MKLKIIFIAITCLILAGCELLKTGSKYIDTIYNIGSKATKARKQSKEIIKVVKEEQDKKDKEKQINNNSE